MKATCPPGARYLLRIDGICPTTNRNVWGPMAELLAETGVKPIVAVVPDNQDPALMMSPPDPAFWDRVREWQAMGWAIGLHGYQHRYVNGEPGILRLKRRSEFAGLPYLVQLDKLRKGLEVFEREKVRADVWVAPSHSFDWVTVSALAALGIHAISDGIAFKPFRDAQGSTWVPQQVARMRPMPCGVWTFCYDPNAMASQDVAHFRERLGQLRPRMIGLADALAMGGRTRSATDELVVLLRKGVRGLRWLAR